MAAFTRPDVYVTETLRPSLRASARLARPVGVFLGESWKGPETPTLVRSWSEFSSQFGGFSGPGTPGQLHFAVHQFFLNGGGACYVSRVTDGSSEAATATLQDRADPAENTVIVTAASKGEWGNRISVQLFERDEGRFDLYVYNGEQVIDANLAERFSDLSMAPTDPRYYEVVINGKARGSKLITVADAGSTSGFPANAPSSGTTQLSGGADGGTPDDEAFVSAVDRIDEIEMPMVINIPGATSTEALNALVAFCEGRGDSFAVIDTDRAAEPSAAIAHAQSIMPASSYAAVYWPWIKITDPAVSRAGVTRDVAPGGAVLGTFLRTDSEQGPHKTPAGITATLRGVTGLVQEATLDELGQLNEASVNAIRVFSDRGPVIMGGRTLKQTGPDRYVAVRRSLIHIRTNLTDITRAVLFEPNDEVLWAYVQTACSSFLRSFWELGGLRGEGPEQAFFVKCDEENNPASAIEEGELHVEVGVALQFPAEFVILKIGQFDSGAASVTEGA